MQGLQGPLLAGGFWSKRLGYRSSGLSRKAEWVQLGLLCLVFPALRLLLQGLGGRKRFLVFAFSTHSGLPESSCHRNCRLGCQPSNLWLLPLTVLQKMLTQIFAISDDAFSLDFNWWLSCCAWEVLIGPANFAAQLHYLVYQLLPSFFPRFYLISFSYFLIVCFILTAFNSLFWACSDPSWKDPW